MIRVRTGTKLTRKHQVTLPVSNQPIIITQPVGRPSIYTQELAAEICAQVAEGKSLRTIIRDDPDNMPSMATIMTWLQVHPEFLEQYTRSKVETADVMAEDIMFIADEVMNGRIEPNAGRVAMEGKKWIASKLKPKKYGDKLDVTSMGEKLPQPLLQNVYENTSNDVIEGEVVDKTPQKSTPGIQPNILDDIK